MTVKHVIVGVESQPVLATNAQQMTALQGNFAADVWRVAFACVCAHSWSVQRLFLASVLCNSAAEPVASVKCSLLMLVRRPTLWLSP